MLLLKTLRLFAFDNLSQVKSDFDQTLRRSDAQHAVKGWNIDVDTKIQQSFCYFVNSTLKIFYVLLKNAFIHTKESNCL